MGYSVGIDLGTTNSVVAVVVGDRVETIPNPEGHKTTPSVVLFGKDEVVVGELAKRQLVTNPGQTIRSAKRLMGRRYAEVEELADEFPFELVEAEGNRAEMRLTDGRVMPPELVSAQILRKMRDTAEDFLGESVDSAVITVPAYFNDAQRTATKRAAELADLHVSRIINEPTAAALAFGFRKTDKPMVIAVFDFGGGTFDISIVQLQEDIFEVLSTNGNTQLGGDDIDQLLYQEICDGILQSTGIDPTQDPQAVARIRDGAERAKMELSSLTATHVSLPFIVADAQGPKHYEREITREEFERLIQPVLSELLPPCRSALEDARLKPGDVEEVILVGGSTRMPIVQKMVAEFFGKPPNHSVNPDEAVAVGAAIQAGVMRGDLAEILLLDVTPLSLGIELAGGVFKPLIERNSSIPCEAARKFTTVIDNQPSVLVHVLQGERAIATHNRTLAQFRLTGIPPMPKELPEIEVTFRIDANGILDVSATELTSGVNTGVQVEGYGECAPLTDAQKEKLLADLAAHSREDREFLQTAHRRAQALRAQSLIQKILDADSDALEERDLKTIKETMLRHDLAIARGEWNIVDVHEEILNRMTEKYEELIPENLRPRAGGALEGLPSGSAPSTESRPADGADDLPELEDLLRQIEERNPGLEDGTGEPTQAGGSAKPPSPPEEDEELEELLNPKKKTPTKRPVRLDSTRAPEIEDEEDFDPENAPPPPPPPA